MGFFSRLFGKKTSIPHSYPSWASNEAKLGEFVSILKDKASSKGIPEQFLHGLFDNDYSRVKFMSIAGIMERSQNASFHQQIEAVFSQIEKYWDNMEDKEMWLN